MIPGKGEINQGGSEIRLNPDQIEAVRHGEGPLLIAAGAGSGKTRTLTERLIHLMESGVPGERIVAITFTNKAAQELKKRVLLRLPRRAEEELPFLGTFHSFGAKILREEAAAFGRSRGYSIFDEDDSKKLVKNIIKALNFSQDKYPVTKVRRDISDIKNELTPLDELKTEMQKIFEEYESALEKQNAFDFDDLIEKPVLLFSRNRLILQKYQDRYDYILVDEFQDVNTCQYLLIKLLAEKHKNLNVVGDDNQSIFKFRGADFRNFLSFERDWPGAKIINLGQNYRSSGNIVSASAAVIENNKLRRKKELWTGNPPGAPIRIVSAYGASEEAQVIADELSKQRGKDTAILYRTNAQSRALEQAFNFSSLPYEIYGGLKFYERKEIKDIVAGLRYAVNPRDEIGLERLDKSLRKAQFRALKEGLPGAAKNMSAVELIGFFLKTADYQNLLKTKFDNYEDRMENIAELINFASEFASSTELVERISLLESADLASSKSSAAKLAAPIKMMTIHLAKGLEFDQVYIVGVTEGLLPHERSLYSPEEIEEERRLMYVAMTRAREKLTISFYSLPSRFLYEIPDNLLSSEDLPTIDEDGVITK